MDTILQSKLPSLTPLDPRAAWDEVRGQLQLEMSRVEFQTWVAPLEWLDYRDGVMTVGAKNAYGREWVESRLKSRITRLLGGLLGEDVSIRLVMLNGHRPSSVAAPALPLVDDGPVTAELPAPQPKAAAREGGSRKLMLARAYGSKRAAVIQPERGMFVTLYFFLNWTPLIGHSAQAVILAARSLCYWNPITGELRNTIETDMSELAERAAVSVRTVKDVLNHELVKRYFLRYRVRRMMTPNGVRTAGILLSVRMDDPLTPTDQESHELAEEERWWSPDVELEDEE
jgi:hypothetical protein